jgi:acyl-CoA thioester hydrolase
MPGFHFHHPIEVRYGDLDPQGHLNNAKFLTFFEQTRVQYLIQLGLFANDQSFMEVGIILAEVKVIFLAPVHFGTDVKVGMRVARIGNKSMLSEYTLIDAGTNRELATGSAVLVAFDYRNRQTIPIPVAWREKIAGFEGLSS